MDELRKFLRFGAVDPPVMVEWNSVSIVDFCSKNVDQLYVIVRDEPLLRRAALIVLKCVFELKFSEEITDIERQTMTDFVLNVMIPVIPQDPRDLSPLAADIFYSFLCRFGHSPGDVLGIFSNMGDDSYLLFLVMCLNRFEPPRPEFVEFSLHVIERCTQSGNSDMIIPALKLLILYLVHYPERGIYEGAIGQFISVLPHTNTTEFWSSLTDLPNDFAAPFLENAMAILADHSNDIELRMSVFYFVVLHFQSQHNAIFDTLLTYLVEFQAVNLQMYDMIDINMYYLFQIALESSEFRVDVSNRVKEATSTLLKSGNIGFQVIGLYNLCYMIDNAPDLSYDLFTDGLDAIRPFLQSGNVVVVDAAIELLMIVIGKQVASTLDFEPIFDDIVVSFTSGSDHIRNRCSVLSYKYLKSRFVDSSWVFDKFLRIMNEVRTTEQPLYLEILARSVMPYRQNVTDEQMGLLLHFISEVMNNSRSFDVKVSASFLWCSLLTKDIDMCLTNGLDSIVLKTFFRVLSNPNGVLRKIMAKSMILLIKCTFGAFNKLFTAFIQPLYQICCGEVHFPVNCEPLLLAEMMKYDDFPNASDFLMRLVQTIHHSPNPKQYNIAAACLRKVLWKTKIDVQVAVATSVCSSLCPGKTLQKSVALLISMLKPRSPPENRLQIAEIICSVFGSIPFESTTSCIGAYCRLASYLVHVFGARIPPNVMAFYKFLIEKTNENPMHYLHYAFFVFAECSRENIIDAETTETLIASAYSVIQQTKSSLDICSALIFLKAVLEKSLDALSPERLAIIVQLWDNVHSSSTYQAATDYLACILLLVACAMPLHQPVLVSVLDSFPPKQERCLTSEMCGFLGTLFSVEQPTELVIEAAKSIIRLLASGKTIRYCNKTGTEVMEQMVRLCVHMIQTTGSDRGLIAEVLADRPRKQEVVMRLLQTFMA